MVFSLLYNKVLFHSEKRLCDFAMIRVMIRSLMHAATLLVLTAIASPGTSQSKPDLQTFFKQNIGLSQDQIVAIRGGQPVAKALPSRTPSEVFLFGAIYIHAAPESYLEIAHDFDRLRELPSYWALGVFSTPPRPSDLKGFEFDGNEIQALKKCTPGDCPIQMPTGSIKEFQRSIDWSASDVNEQVNGLLQKRALQRLLAYQRKGNHELGAYNDKPDAVDVPAQFAYMLSYDKALPAYLPDFYTYLLAYPDAKPANVDDAFYWAKVKFGLKPTLRVVQMTTMRGDSADPVAYAIAEKQLYSSHYFETALDLSFCVRGSDDPKHRGFYLIKLMGSEQAGLTGAKGSIIRKAAVGRSVSSLQKGLTSIKNTLEGNE